MGRKLSGLRTKLVSLMLEHFRRKMAENQGSPQLEYGFSA